MLGISANLVAVNPATLALMTFGSQNSYLQVLTTGSISTTSNALNQSCLRNDEQSCQISLYGLQDCQSLALGVQLDFCVQGVTNLLGLTSQIRWLLSA